MALKTATDYLNSLRKLDLRVYLLGEKVLDPVDHPIIRPSVNSVAKTYELAVDEEHSNLMTAKSNLTGENVNRFCHLHQRY